MPSTSLDALISRADLLLKRLEHILPHALSAPDWGASTAFRYRKRGASGLLQPVRQVAASYPRANVSCSISDIYSNISNAIGELPA